MRNENVAARRLAEKKRLGLTLVSIPGATVCALAPPLAPPLAAFGFEAPLALPAATSAVNPMHIPAHATLFRRIPSSRFPLLDVKWPLFPNGLRG